MSSPTIRSPELRNSLEPSSIDIIETQEQTTGMERWVMFLIS